jgi:hypothetical protein
MHNLFIRWWSKVRLIKMFPKKTTFKIHAVMCGAVGDSIRTMLFSAILPHYWKGRDAIGQAKLVDARSEEGADEGDQPVLREHQSAQETKVF